MTAYRARVEFDPDPTSLWRDAVVGAAAACLVAREGQGDVLEADLREVLPGGGRRRGRRRWCRHGRPRCRGRPRGRTSRPGASCGSGSSGRRRSRRRPGPSVRRTETAVGLDTGCVHGRQLTPYDYRASRFVTLSPDATDKNRSSDSIVTPQAQTVPTEND